jgi:Protein of unknown function (DUF1573)
MKKRSLAAVGLVLACLSIAPAQMPLQTPSPWANKLFGSQDAPTYDFGIVPSGTMLEHDFMVTNIYKVPIEITHISTSMAPVNADVLKRKLQPGEKTTLALRLDGTRFVGRKQVTVYVTFGPEHVSEARLLVKATSRLDLVCNPCQVEFGKVRLGQTPSASFDVEQSGQKDWQVTGLDLPKNAPFETTYVRVEGRPGIVSYRVTVTLKMDAPSGAIFDRIAVKTNHPDIPVFPILVSGRVGGK